MYESPDDSTTIHTAIYCDSRKLATARWDVWRLNEEHEDLSIAPYFSALQFTNIQGQRCFNFDGSVI